MRRGVLDDLDHPHLPFDRLVELVNPSRTAAHHPLFQVMLAFQDDEVFRVQLPGLRTEAALAPTGGAQFDLLFALSEHTGADGAPQGVTGQVDFAADLFDPGTVRLLVDRLSALLDAATAAPHQPISALDLTLPAERRLLAEWNRTGHQDTPTTLPALVAARAAACPDAVALVHGATVLTYREFDQRVERLARRLTALGAGPERTVAVALPRPSLVTARVVRRSAPARPICRSTRTTRPTASPGCSPTPRPPACSPPRRWFPRCPRRSPPTGSPCWSRHRSRTRPAAGRPVRPPDRRRTTPPTSSTPRAPPAAPRACRSPTGASSTGCAGCSTPTRSAPATGCCRRRRPDSTSPSGSSSGR
ncbi:AMP-binding protein [Streptacidiphilus sp. 4-A2]|nr:AMP-binding protein [Streptacidiphilus sp. 4-A2]